MMQQVSQRVLRLFLSGSLLALLLLTLNVSKTHASPTTACGSSITASTGTPGVCTLGALASATAGILSYTVDSSLVISSGTGTPPTGSTNGTITGTGSSLNPYTYTLNGANQTFNIAFGTTVSDGRGGTTGWSLAASTDLPTNFMKLTGATATCTSSCFPIDSALSQTLPLTLTSAAQEFIGAPASTGPANGGDYSIATTGSLSIPGDITAGTNFAGNLTITLNNANF